MKEFKQQFYMTRDGFIAFCYSVPDHKLRNITGIHETDMNVLVEHLIAIKDYKSIRKLIKHSNIAIDILLRNRGRIEMKDWLEFLDTLERQPVTQYSFDSLKRYLLLSKSVNPLVVREQLDHLKRSRDFAGYLNRLGKEVVPYLSDVNAAIAIKEIARQ